MYVYMYFVPQRRVEREKKKDLRAKRLSRPAQKKKNLEWRGVTLNITLLYVESHTCRTLNEHPAANHLSIQTMASEALHCEAEESSASSAPAEMSGIEAAASSIDENPISASQQAHVSDAGADATQQNASDNGDGAASQAPSMRMPNANLCGVCEINPGKYKCSRCRLP